MACILGTQYKINKQMNGPIDQSMDLFYAAIENKPGLIDASYKENVFNLSSERTEFKLSNETELHLRNECFDPGGQSNRQGAQRLSRQAFGGKLDELEKSFPIFYIILYCSTATVVRHNLLYFFLTCKTQYHLPRSEATAYRNFSDVW